MSAVDSIVLVTTPGANAGALCASSVGCATRSGLMATSSTTSSRNPPRNLRRRAAIYSPHTEQARPLTKPVRLRARWRHLLQCIHHLAALPARYSLLTGRHAANATSIISHRPWNLVGFNTFLTGRSRQLLECSALLAIRRASLANTTSAFHCRRNCAPAAVNTAVVERASRIQIVQAVRERGGFSEAPAVFGGNKQTASSAHHPEWLTLQAVNCLQRARSRKQPGFVYYAPTLPHAPFSLPDSLVHTNVSITPAGLVEPDPSWAIERKQLLNQLTSKGHVCASHITRCNPAAATPCEEQYVFREGEERRPSACSPLVSSAIALSKDRWIDPSWLLAKENCEQRRLAHLFAAGLAWIDIGVGKLLKSLHPKQSMVILTSDHGASFLGKGSPYEAGIRVPLIVRWGGEDAHRRHND